MSTANKTNFKLNQYNKIEVTDFNNVISTKKEEFNKQYLNIVNSLDEVCSEPLFNSLYSDLEASNCFVCNSKDIPFWNFVVFDNKLLTVKCNRPPKQSKKKSKKEENEVDNEVDDNVDQDDETEIKPEHKITHDNSIQVYIPQLLKAYNLNQQAFTRWKKYFIKLNDKQDLKICDTSNKWLYINMLIPFLSFASVDFLTRLTNKTFFDYVTKETNSKMFAEDIIKAPTIKVTKEKSTKKIVIQNVIEDFEPDSKNPADVKAFEEEKIKPLNTKIIVVDSSVDLNENKYTGIKEKTTKKDKKSITYKSQARRENFVIEDMPSETSCKLIFNFLKENKSKLIEKDKDVKQIISCIPLVSNMTKKQFDDMVPKLKAYIIKTVEKKEEEAKKKKEESDKKKEEAKEKRKAKAESSKAGNTEAVKLPSKPQKKINITDEIDDDEKPKSKAKAKAKQIKKEESEEADSEDSADEIQYNDNLDIDDF